MITLHILKLLENEGFGTIDTDLFFEEAPLDSTGKPKEGVWIVTRGSAVNRLNVGIQNFDIYARYSNKIKTAQKLEDILDYLKEAYGMCDLPQVPPYSLAQYTNVTITPTSSVENVGTDENEKIVKVISGEIRFNKGA
jgi:hypothetical protein